VFLKAGETRKVPIPLNRDAFAFYDPDKRAWVVENDEFNILVGSSSRDIRLKETANLFQPAAR
jgi:beta-glucosidase